MAIDLSDTNFQETVNNSELLVVDFYANWCAPCRALSTVLEQVKGLIKVAKVDVEENPKITNEQKISALPTLLWYKNGNLVSKTLGFMDKASIEKKINELKAE